MLAVKKTDSNSVNIRHMLMETIKDKSVANPVIQRLRQNISGKTGLAITSYDRMHHRHNRS